MMKLILVIVLALTASINLAYADVDNSIMLEFGFGFGSSGEIKKAKNGKLTCSNLQADGMKIISVRLRSNNIETHASRFWGDSSHKKCDRNSYAIGVGYVFANNGDVYASITPGIAYTFGAKKEQYGRSNWRLKSPIQFFGRAALGVHNDNANFEVALTRYGLPWDAQRSESFVTLGLGVVNQDKDAAGQKEMDKPVVMDKPIVDEHTTITHEHVTEVEHVHPGTPDATQTIEHVHNNPDVEHEHEIIHVHDYTIEHVPGDTQEHVGIFEGIQPHDEHLPLNDPNHFMHHHASVDETHTVKEVHDGGTFTETHTVIVPGTPSTVHIHEETTTEEHVSHSVEH